VDHGPNRAVPNDDYPVYCVRAAVGVAADLAAGIEALGVVIGGSGNGEQMSANKVRGIRAALAWSAETARLAREHNDAQVVAIGARMHSTEDALGFAATFLATPFSGDPRHSRRIRLLATYEATGDLPPLPTD
jgi:ribose 5-phosphate isomerase B